MSSGLIKNNLGNVKASKDAWPSWKSNVNVVKVELGTVSDSDD